MYLLLLCISTYIYPLYMYFLKISYLGEWAVSMTVHCESCCVHLYYYILLFYHLDLFLLLPLPVSIIMDHWTKFWGSMWSNIIVRDHHTLLCLLCVSVLYCVNKRAFYCQSAFIYSFICVLQKRLMFRSYFLSI